MKNIGINTHRFKQNPKEKIFAEEWNKINTDHNLQLNGRGVLEFILGDVTISEHDRELAATVIQWLGSPVGESFLTKVGNRINTEVK